MLRGTRLLMGKEAADYTSAIRRISSCLKSLDFNEVIIPSIWNTETFTAKLGAEKENQMWTFQDKGQRECCLIPEVTGIIQEQWRDTWSKSEKRPMRIFYVSRCYRYERPQAGRYREFTQIGVEILGSKNTSDKHDAIYALRCCLELFNVQYKFVESVKRGLEYYVEDGFEVECENLGAQKQVAGGGRYDEGIGWAIGLERLLLAVERENDDSSVSTIDPKTLP